MSDADPSAGAPARRLAARLLAVGAAGGELERRQGRVLEPVAIRSPEGRAVGWFVGVGVGDTLIGFMVLSPGLELRRYSTFLRRPDAVDACPRIADWLDPARVLERAATLARSGEKLADPVFSYDQVPDRIAWAVRATGAEGVTRTLFVTGNFAYEGRPAGEPSTGGPRH